MTLNEFGQPIGPALPHWTPAQPPQPVTLAGQSCTLAPLEADQHASDLFNAYALAPDDSAWTYMKDGPFATSADYFTWARKAQASTDPRHYVVLLKSSADQPATKPAGTMALVRQDPNNGVVEVGTVQFSPLLQRTRAATEAQFLLMRYVFDDLGYRRYEWKCDDLHSVSRRAATRLGFTYEGTFRNAVVYKGRSRDTAWFAITDAEWPAVRAGFERWLDPANFNADGTQIRSLAQCREEPRCV